MTAEEAAKILGVTAAEVRKHQSEGLMPDPIPDDYLDAFVQFRIDLAKAHMRKLVKQQGDDVAQN